MSIPTLTMLIVVASLTIFIGARWSSRVSGKTRAVRERVARIAGKQITPEAMPRVSRNRWERRDLARTLMTEDDYLGQITDPR